MLIVYSGLVISYIISLFFELVWLETITGIFSLLSVLFSFPKATSHFKRTGITFLAIGTLLMFIYKLPLLSVPKYMTATVMLMALFYVLPFMNSIITIGRYDKNVNKLLKTKVKSLGQLYIRSSFTSYAIGMFLNIGMIPFVYQVLERNLKDQLSKIKALFISQSMLRAYALCLVWSPMEILVGLSIDITGASYLQMVPFLLTLSVLLLIVDWIVARKYNRYKLPEQKNIEVLNKNIFKSVIRLFVYLIFFIISIILFQLWIDFNFLTTVTLLIVPYSFLWAVTLGKFKSYLRYSLTNWKKRTSSLQNYMVLFLSVGFFISTLRETGLIEYLQYPFKILSEIPILTFLIIQFMFLGLAMVGFHPLVTMSIIGEAIAPALEVLHPISVGIVLITSGLSTVMSGPYNITVSLTSLLVHKNPYRISWYNLWFAFLLSSSGTLLAVLISLF